MYTYMGDMIAPSTLSHDIDARVTASVEASKAAVKDSALAQMARVMFDQFGDMDGLIRELHYAAPTVIYRDTRCIGFAATVQPYYMEEELLNFYDSSRMDREQQNNKITAVEVPPGYRLEMYDEDNYSGESYVVYGKFREDLQGVECQIIDESF